MEFEHLGSHCEVSDCRMKDFLPFICETCKGTYCSDHRSYSSHGCVGALAKDMTSLDCPICNCCVKFSKAESSDAVWERHYLTECSQSSAQAPKLAKRTCARADCRSIMGPSNSHVCRKCNKSVCLSHRLPEEHPCVGTTADLREKRLEALNSRGNTNVKPAAASSMAFGTNKLVPKGNNNAKAKPVQDTIYSTSNRRSEAYQKSLANGGSSSNQTSSTATATIAPPAAPIPRNGTREQYPCPVCVQVFEDPVMLISHMEASHPNHGKASASNLPAPRAASATAVTAESTGLEICPQCNKRFNSINELIAHVETHNTNSDNSKDKCVVQ